MQAIFNETSAPQKAYANKDEAGSLILSLIQVCKKLSELDSTFLMRTNKDFWNIQLYNSNSIKDIIQEYDMDNYSFLMRITDSPNLPDNEIDIDQDKFFDQSLNCSGSPLGADSGIRVAYAFCPIPAPIISFVINGWQKKDNIDVTFGSNQRISLMNIATKEQLFEKHFERLVLGHLDTTTGNPAKLDVDNILPNRAITNSYLDYCQLYEKQQNGKALNRSISITQIKKIGIIVATLNGWSQNNNYTKLNKRVVFVHQKSNNFFISIDTENGDFEIHRMEDHMGAIPFDGNKAKPAKNHKLRFE